MNRCNQTSATAAATLLSIFLLSGCGGGSGSGSSGPPADTTAPTAPPGFAVSNLTGISVDLSWQPATDNVGVTGYRVYRNSARISNNAQSPLTDTGLTPGVEYCYAVSAYDAAGNESTRSADVCVTPVHEPPVAALDAPRSALPGTVLTFDASASSATDGGIASYEFDFGDSTGVLSQSTPVAQHTYSDVGNFVASVTVVDSLADEATTSVAITVGLRVGQQVNVSRTPQYSQTPDAVRAPDGSIYVVWEESRDDIKIARSTDGGASFGTPAYVIDPAGPWGSDDDWSSAQMRIVATATDVHIAWTIFDLLFGGAEIFHLRSDDGGQTFTAPVIVSAIDAYNSTNPTLAAADDGSVLIAWVDEDFAAGPLRGIHRTRSTDRGDSFPVPSHVSNSAGWLCPNVNGTGFPARLAAMASEPEPAEIALVQSNDGAQTFSPPLVLDNVGEKSWCPQLATDSADTIYVAWEEGEAFNDRKILFARSTDGGITFSSPALLSAAATDNICPAIATDDVGRVYVVWSQHAGTEVGESFLALSLDSGLTFSAPLRIAVDPLSQGYQGCFRILPGTGNEIGLVWNTQQTASSFADVYFVNAEVPAP